MITASSRSRRTARKEADVVSHDERATLTSFESALGWMAIAWREDALCGVVFGYSSRRNAEIALAHSLRILNPRASFSNSGLPGDAPHWVKELVDGLRRFAEGEAVDFSDMPLALEHLTPFARRVVAACRSIHWGQTKSYGELASECDAPGAARAVGTVMAKNRFPLVVPCHRVLAAGGAIGGYSAPEGLAMKRRLLAMEQPA